MKKILLLLSLIISMVCNGQSHDIREVNWGWSMSKVKEAEKLKLFHQNESSIFYHGDLDNKNFSVIYQFVKSKLVHLFYVYNETHINMNNYVEAYNDLKQILSDKYSNNI